MILPALSFTALAFVMLRDVLKFRFRAVLNPFFWLSLYSLFYFVIPSFFVEEISYYYNWGITAESIFYSHLIVFLFCFLVSGVYFFLPSNFSVLDLKHTVYQCSPLVKMAWWLVFVYLCYVLLKTYQSFDLLDAFQYDGKQNDPYKVKNIAYLLLTLTVLYFLSIKKYWVFFPNLIVIVIDLLNGSRTTAFIALAPVLLCLCCQRQTLFIIPSSLLVSGLLFLGVVRSDNIVQQVPWYINAMGEFRETYITLPLFICNDNYVGEGNIFDFLSVVGIGLIQPLRSELIEQFSLAGLEIYYLVGRGYGLGANLIIESLFYGYIAFFLIACFAILFCITLYLLLQKVNFAPYMIINSLIAVVFLRIFVREGLPAGIGLFFFVSLIYILPLLLINRFVTNNKGL